VSNFVQTSRATSAIVVKIARRSADTQRAVPVDTRPHSFECVMPDQSPLTNLLAGAIAGWPVGRIVQAHGFGISGDIIFGVAGVFIGARLMRERGVGLGSGVVAAQPHGWGGGAPLHHQSRSRRKRMGSTSGRRLVTLVAIERALRGLTRIPG
jgi:uncharacterized membrane protein YeaQ/YmgE (transglycosylase-associated protein family)